MSEILICHSCGQSASTDAKYCSRCGAALVPPTARSARGVDRILSKASSLHIGVLGLVLLTSISVFAAHLIVTGFNFQWSIVLLALVLGAGCGCLGWQWTRSLSPDSRIVRMLLIFASMAVALLVVWLIDWACLTIVAGGGGVVYAIPGVYVEALAEGRHLVIVDAPPYWLLVTLWGVFAATLGNLVYIAVARLSK